VQHLEEEVNSNGVGFLYDIHYSIGRIIVVKIIIFSEGCRYSDWGHGMDELGFKSQRGKGFLLSPKGPDQLWDTSSLLFQGNRRSFLRVMLPEREVDHSPHSIAEIKNE
jgi:hypothetical protein